MANWYTAVTMYEWCGMKLYTVWRECPEWGSAHIVDDGELEGAHDIRSLTRRHRKAEFRVYDSEGVPSLRVDFGAARGRQDKEFVRLARRALGL